MRLALLAVGIPTLVASAACGNEYHPEYHPESAYSVNQTVMYGTTILQAGGSSPPVVANASPPPVAAGAPAEAQPPGDPSRVLVIDSPSLDRPGEVVGVVDVEAAGSHDAALVLLRQRAAALGADAVVGVEYHDGESEGRPNHVSGLAIRFPQGTRRP